MKYRIILLSFAFFIYLINRNGFHPDSIEFLTIGYDQTMGSLQFNMILLNFFINSIFTILLLNRILKLFGLSNYLYTRGRFLDIVNFITKKMVCEILIILILKQFVYCIFYFISKAWSVFYFYDMISTVLTYIILGFIIICLKLFQVKNKIIYFLILMSMGAIQILSYKWSFFSLFIVASINWRDSYLLVFGGKISFILLLYILISKINPEKLMIGVCDEW